MFSLNNEVDFYVNDLKELQKVLSYVEKYHDNIIICVDNDEYEILNIYYDEIYQNYNLDVLDSTNYLLINDFIVESIEEIEELIKRVYSLN